MSEFYLVIVDNNKNTREQYKIMLSDKEKGHIHLRNNWKDVKDFVDANEAYKWFSDEMPKDAKALVIADTFMEPNCKDGSNVDDAKKLFGGLWLINEIYQGEKEKYMSEESKLYNRTKVLLVTRFYDDGSVQEQLVRNYITDKNDNFPYKEGDDYYFLKKPKTINKNITEDENAKQWTVSLFSDTFRAIENIISNSYAFSISDNKKQSSSFEKIIGKSEKINQVKVLIDKAARNDATVLITGENGTGKELIAKAIHELSSRASNAFVTINCSAVPRDLFESELFGYEKGAFTGAVAEKKGYFEIGNKGTIFLDEVADLELHSQVKILRAIQEGEIEKIGRQERKNVNVRIIAATNKDLETEIEAERFRQDLYYRLNVIRINCPSLKERKKDIPLLTDFFLSKYETEFSKRNIQINQEARSCLTTYDWPGNIRELENIIKGSVAISHQGANIDKAMITERFRKNIKKEKVIINSDIKIQDLEEALLQYYFNKGITEITKLSEAMGLSQSTISKNTKLKAFYDKLVANSN